jgi:hypothetical protein
MSFHFDNVQKAIHAMLNDVVEQGFKHSLEFPNDLESAHKIIENANISLTDIINLARKDNLIPNADIKQEAFRHTIQKAEKTSLKLLSELQLMRRRQIMTRHKLKKSDLVTR